MEANDTDWAAILKLIEESRCINEKVISGAIPKWIFDIFKAPIDLKNLKNGFDDLNASFNRFSVFFLEFISCLDFESARFVLDKDFIIIRQYIESWQTHTDELNKIVHLNHWANYVKEWLAGIF